MVEIKNLHIAFASGALKLAHWHVEKGAHTLVLGPSGSGKSTLLNILGGLAAKISENATVTVCGAQPYLLSGHQRDAFRAQHIGFVTQRLHLINAITVAENLRLSLRLSDKRHSKQAEDALISGILEQFNIANKGHSKPSSLSVGEAQRVAIARALVKQPALLLADEPTSALDDVNALNAAHLLLNAARSSGSTLIVATHDARIKHLFNGTLNLQATA